MAPLGHHQLLLTSTLSHQQTRSTASVADLCHQQTSSRIHLLSLTCLLRGHQASFCVCSLEAKNLILSRNNERKGVVSPKVSSFCFSQAAAGVPWPLSAFISWQEALLNRPGRLQIMQEQTLSRQELVLSLRGPTQRAVCLVLTS